MTLSVEASLRSLFGENRSPAIIKAYRGDLAWFVAWLAENDVTAPHMATVTRPQVEASRWTLPRRESC